MEYIFIGLIVLVIIILISGIKFIPALSTQVLTMLYPLSKRLQRESP